MNKFDSKLVQHKHPETGELDTFLDISEIRRDTRIVRSFDINTLADALGLLDAISTAKIQLEKLLGFPRPYTNNSIKPFIIKNREGG